MVAHHEDGPPPALSRLSTDSGSWTPDRSRARRKPKQPVADSWEDEDLSNLEEGDGAVTPQNTHQPGTAAPPPTPASPRYTPLSIAGSMNWPSDPGVDYPCPAPSSSPAPPTDGGRRPEKTDVVARRMIAAGLGIKAPTRTEEQRAYQKSVTEQEKKRLEQERADERRHRDEAERAKAAVWDD